MTIDVRDVEVQRRFWADALGYEIVEGPYALLRDPDREGVTLYFQAVPEAKTVKNRVHLDLVADDPSAERDRLVGCGATSVRPMEEQGLRWEILHDPEGNEFCIFPTTTAGEG